jgi:hypothetical protein
MESEALRSGIVAHIGGNEQTVSHTSFHGVFPQDLGQEWFMGFINFAIVTFKLSISIPSYVEGSAVIVSREVLTSVTFESDCQWASFVVSVFGDARSSKLETVKSELNSELSRIEDRSFL